MDTEFKEKTYEKYFGHEVARLTNVTFSPDQCDEFFLGFDEAFLLPIHRLELLAPFRRRSRWARMQGISLQDLDRLINEISRRMPPFRFNLFVQYKRPVYLISRGAGEWLHWQCPYYRYPITPHQQIALENIDAYSQGRAAIVYASPAFWRGDDLWANVKAESIISSSNIASVGRLTGHGHYSYAFSGFVGKAHSDTVSVESPAFRDLISLGLQGEALPLSQHLKRVAGLIARAVNGSDGVARIFEAARTAVGVDEFREDSVADALSVIEVFSDSFGVSYYAIG